MLTPALLSTLQCAFVRPTDRTIRSAESEPSRALLRLLQIEYRNLDQNARHHPATKALAEVFARVDKQSNIVVISHHNHDAEALAFNTYNLTRRGNAVVTV